MLWDEGGVSHLAASAKLCLSPAGKHKGHYYWETSVVIQTHTHAHIRARTHTSRFLLGGDEWGEIEDRRGRDKREKAKKENRRKRRKPWILKNTPLVWSILLLNRTHLIFQMIWPTQRHSFLIYTLRSPVPYSLLLIKHWAFTIAINKILTYRQKRK